MVKAEEDQGEGSNFFFLLLFRRGFSAGPPGEERGPGSREREQGRGERHTPSSGEIFSSYGTVKSLVTSERRI